MWTILTAKTSSPPIDSFRNTIPKLSQYSQVVTINPVDPKQLSVTLPKTITNRTAVRVVVQVMFKPTSTSAPEPVYQTAWVRTSE